MKPTSLLFFGAFSIAALSASAVPVLTADFEELDLSAPVGATYSESGIVFSGDGLLARDRYISSVFFSGSWWSHPSTTLLVDNSGWLTLSLASGADIYGLSLDFGADWNVFAVALGLLHPVFEWQGWSDSVLVDSGQLAGSSGSFTLQDRLLDTVRLRSVTPEFGNLNHLAIDNVTVWAGGGSVNNVPDGTSTFALLAVGLLGLVGVARGNLRRAR